MAPFHKKRHSIVISAPATKLDHESSYDKFIQEAEHESLPGIHELQGFMQQPNTFSTRMVYINLFSQQLFDNIDDLLREVEYDRKDDNIAICVIENISPYIISRLGSAWSIDPAFFTSHVTNPDDRLLWSPHEWDWPSPNSAPPVTHDRITGIYEFHQMDMDMDAMQNQSTNYCHRSIFKDGTWPVNCTTSISYLRISETLYLFLVDPPVAYSGAIRHSKPKRPAPTLRFPYSQSYGGLQFPSINTEVPLSPLDAIRRVFGHRGPLLRLFQKPATFPKAPLVYMISSSLWYSKLRELDQRIREISFNELSQPNENTTSTLHNLREEVVTMRRAMAHTTHFTLPSINEFYQEMWRDFPNPKLLMPTGAHSLVHVRAGELNTFLLETFQLLMNTISIRDSQLSIKLSYSALHQSNAGIILTRLAVIYLPLTLATGVFGMNISQLNDSGQSIWVFIVTCSILLVSTYLLMIFRLRKLRKDAPLDD